MIKGEYIVYSGKAIVGYNNKRLTNVTPDQCQDACTAETSFSCKSIDYIHDSNSCDLSSENKDSKTLASYPGTHTHYHFEKKVFTPEECNSECLKEESQRCKEFTVGRSGTASHGTCHLYHTECTKDGNTSFDMYRVSPHVLPSKTPEKCTHI